MPTPVAGDKLRNRIVLEKRVARLFVSSIKVNVPIVANFTETDIYHHDFMKEYKLLD
jgi:hypothetical protein